MPEPKSWNDESEDGELVEALELLSSLIELLAEYPEAAFVKSHESPYSASLDILMHADDADMMIHMHRGDLIRSLRILFSAIYRRHDKRILLNVVNTGR